jgi:hypothetical protein
MFIGRNAVSAKLSPDLEIREAKRLAELLRLQSNILSKSANHHPRFSGLFGPQ